MSNSAFAPEVRGQAKAFSSLLARSVREFFKDEANRKQFEGWYENGKATGISAYRIANCRRWYVFRYENGELFTDKYTMGWRKVKTLEGIPASVMAAVKAICER